MDWKIRKLGPPIGPDYPGVLRGDVAGVVEAVGGDAGNLSVGDEAGDYAAIREAVMEVVRQQFRPEFINRVDETVVFHPLARDQLKGIAAIQLDYLRQRLVDRDMGLRLSDKALEKLVEAGFDPVYGARPLKRAIQQQLENPLAQALLKGEFGPGDTIEVDVAGSEMVFRKG